MSADRDNLEDWLRDHPAAHDDLADLARLRELYQSANPPEPEEAVWNSVHSRIAGSLVRGGSPRRWWVIAAGSLAAAILAVLLARPMWSPSVPVPDPEIVQHVEEPFPVVDEDDVSIISMDARDVAALVVGEPPVGDEIEFARPEDIRVIRCERCPYSGRQARLEPGSEVPMLVTAAVAPGNE